MAHGSHLKQEQGCPRNAPVVPAIATQVLSGGERSHFIGREFVWLLVLQDGIKGIHSLSFFLDLISIGYVKSILLLGEGVFLLQLLFCIIHKLFFRPQTQLLS